MIRLAVNGATGRMGSRVIALGRDDARFEVVATIDSSDGGHADASRGSHPRIECDVIIDFSTDQGARSAADAALACGAALLVGTTALSPQTLEKAAFCAQSIPVMLAPNTSRGIAVLKHLAAVAARLLGSEVDVDITETHHRNKRDAPSGTALALADSLRSGGANINAQRMHSIRAGDVIGEHEVAFAASGERLKIFHEATSRDVFALGALEASAWLIKQPPGMYRIEQSLGLD